MKFRSRATGALRITTEAGTGLAPKYEIELDGQNHKTVIKVGTHNLYAEIQSHLEETRIENILAAALLGDNEALNRMEGKYLDATEFPKSLAEAQNQIIKLTAEFEKLPLETRRAFNFSVEEFIASFGTETFAEKMGIKTEDTLEKVEITEPVIKKGETIADE